MTLRELKRNNHTDNFQTPDEAIEILLPYLKKEWQIWEPAAGKKNLSTFLEKAGFKIHATDLNEGVDFLKMSIECDAIISNPPYTLKDKFLERAYYLEKPFAFLLPITALEGKKRHEMYRKHGIEVLVPDGRINFETPSGKPSSAWFATAWFCKGLLPEKIIFADSPIPPSPKGEGILGRY